MLTLVRDGTAQARIAVGRDVSPSAKFAAKELQTYIQKSTGATIPIAETLGDDEATDFSKILSASGGICQ
jgi:hypothetical protein